MDKRTPQASVRLDGRIVRCQGSWTLLGLSQVERALAGMVWPVTGSLTFEASKIEAFDTGGVVLLYRALMDCRKRGCEASVEGLPGLRQEAGKPSMASGRLQILNILAPLDFSSSSLDAVEYASHLAKGLDAAVTLMHVLEPVCYGLRPGHDRRGNRKTRPLDPAIDGVEGGGNLLRIAGRFRDLGGNAFRCDPGLRLAASI